MPEVNEDNPLLHRGKFILKAFSYLGILFFDTYQNLTVDRFLESFVVVSETMLRKSVQLKWIDFKNGEIHLVHGWEDSVKVWILPNLIYRYNSVPVRVPARYLIETDKLILKLIWKGKGIRIVRTILKKNKIGEFPLPNFKTYCKVKVIKTLWYWKQGIHYRSLEQGQVQK